MIYLPGACERCRNVVLIANADCIDGQALCGSCGGLVSIFEGIAYPEGDVLLFNELLTRLESSGIAGLEAEQLAVSLDSARSSVGTHKALSLAMARVATLEPLWPLLAASVGRAGQALSMLETILRALARQRRSGFSVRGDVQRLTASPGPARWKDEEPLPRVWAQIPDRRDRRR